MAQRPNDPNRLQLELVLALIGLLSLILTSVSLGVGLAALAK